MADYMRTLDCATRRYLTGTLRKSLALRSANPKDPARTLLASHFQIDTIDKEACHSRSAVALLRILLMHMQNAAIAAFKT